MELNKPVDFSTAKLLKKKRFNLKVKQRWGIVENIDGDKTPFCQYDCGLFNWNNEKYADYISAPTIAEVVMWLYEKHGIWIGVNREVENGIFYFSVDKDKGNFFYDKGDDYNSPTEAYEAAIEYTLKHLI